jgi:hypothetical protein
LGFRIIDWIYHGDADDGSIVQFEKITAARAATTEPAIVRECGGRFIWFIAFEAVSKAKLRPDGLQAYATFGLLRSTLPANCDKAALSVFCTENSCERKNLEDRPNVEPFRLYRRADSNLCR